MAEAEYIVALTGSNIVKLFHLSYAPSHRDAAASPQAWNGPVTEKRQLPTGAEEKRRKRYRLHIRSSLITVHLVRYSPFVFSLPKGAELAKCSYPSGMMSTACISGCPVRLFASCFKLNATRSPGTSSASPLYERTPKKYSVPLSPWSIPDLPFP